MANTLLLANLKSFGIEAFESPNGDISVRDERHHYAFMVTEFELARLRRDPTETIQRMMYEKIAPDLPVFDYDKDAWWECFKTLKIERKANNDTVADDGNGHHVTITSDDAFYWAFMACRDIRELVACRMLDAQKPKWHKPRANWKLNRLKVLSRRKRKT